MKRKELTTAFKTISNRKIPLVLLVHKKNIIGVVKVDQTAFFFKNFSVLARLVTSVIYLFKCDVFRLCMR